MKKVILTLTLALATLCAFAQDFPAGMRMEIAGVSEGGEFDENEFQVFTYKDADGSYGYYLSLGHTTNILSIFGADGDSFSFGITLHTIYSSFIREE